MAGPAARSRPPSPSTGCRTPCRILPTTRSSASSCSTCRPGAPMDDDAAVGAEALALRLIGLPESEALALVAREGGDMRVARRDDQRMALTMDYRPGRITVEVEEGRTVRAEVT